MSEEIYVIKCVNCEEMFDSEESLKLLKDEDGYFMGCPMCETDKYLIDLTDDDLKVELDELKREIFNTIDKMYTQERMPNGLALVNNTVTKEYKMWLDVDLESFVKSYVFESLDNKYKNYIIESFG